MRRVIEKISRGRVFKRHLPKCFGSRPIWVSPDARLRFLKPMDKAFDLELLAYVVKYVSPNDHVWDVGANVGEFSIASAHVTGPGGFVVALEADIELAVLLQRSILEKNNDDLNLTLVCMAASDKRAFAEFRIAERARASNSLVGVDSSSQTGGVRHTVTVPTICLDDLVEKFGLPDVIKIDVEGAEQKVLQGAVNILRTARPKLIVEVNSTNSLRVAQFLLSESYKIYDAEYGVEGGELTNCTFNTLALPNS